jgi:hypothetical protein
MFHFQVETPGTYLVDRLEFDELPEFVLYERPWVSKSTSLGKKTEQKLHMQYTNFTSKLHYGFLQ